MHTPFAIAVIVDGHAADTTRSTGAGADAGADAVICTASAKRKKDIVVSSMLQWGPILSCLLCG